MILPLFTYSMYFLSFLGNPIAHHPLIPLEDVLWLHDVVSSGVPFERAIYLLRRRFFPHYHDPHPWMSGVCLSLSNRFVQTGTLYMWC